MKPHIIFLLSDQHNADVMSWRGDTVIATPHLDRLAADGTAQTNCYCASPLCVPSRSSMLATQLPQQTGVFINEQCLPSDRITFVHELAIAGYRTVLAGRMHFKGPDQRHGFHERLVGDIGDTTWGGRKAGAGLRQFHHYGAGHTSLDEAGPGASRVLAYDEAVIAGACERMAQQPDDTPLFMTVGLYGPHNPYVCDPERFAHYYARLPRLEPANISEDLHPAIVDYYQQMRMTEPDTEALHRARAAYYGLVDTLDAHVGRLRSAAQEALGDNVVFVYSSDHGDMAGSHGTFWKQLFYDGAARVPMIAAGPGIIAGQRITEPTSLLDLGPTLLAMTDAQPMIESDGIDLWPSWRGDTTPDPERPIISQLANRKASQLPTAMIRQGRYKLVSHGVNDQRPQLFDMPNDPHETNDLGAAPTPAQRETIARLQAELAKHWNPAAADRTAKLATSHKRRLWHFEKDHDQLTGEGWTGAFDEQRLAGC